MMHCAAILCDIRSVHNVGSIFRTADGAGFEKIYLYGVTPSPLDRFGKVRSDFAKVALGAEAGIAWETVSDIKDLVTVLKREGWTIFALEQADRSMPIDSMKCDTGKCALMVGNEVGGIAPGILALADTVVEIPMLGKKESLNVSVAFGIAAYALRSSAAAA